MRRHPSSLVLYFALRSSVVCAALLCASQALAAQGDWGASVGVTSDYISYGLSQTRGRTALQADGHYRKTLQDGSVALFGGAWISTLNSDQWDDSELELDGYLGTSWRVSPRSVATFTFTHYAYAGESSWGHYDYDEVSATLGFANRLFGTIVWTPDSVEYTGFATQRCCRRMAYEVEVHQPLPRHFTFALGAGYADLIGTAGYAFWNAGLSRMFGGLELNVSYIGTQSRAESLFTEAVAGSRFAGSALWRFGGR